MKFKWIEMQVVFVCCCYSSKKCLYGVAIEIRMIMPTQFQFVFKVGRRMKKKVAFIVYRWNIARDGAFFRTTSLQVFVVSTIVAKSCEIECIILVKYRCFVGRYRLWLFRRGSSRKLWHSLILYIGPIAFIYFNSQYFMFASIFIGQAFRVHSLFCV